jgi:selenium metabolism protein YedF
MKKSIDAKGQVCPQPLILSRRMLAAGGLDEIEVRVDNEAARENVVRFLRFAGSSAPAVAVDGSVSTIVSAVSPAMIAKAGGKTPAPACEEEETAPGAQPGGTTAQALNGKTLFFSSDQVGRGDEALGRLLIRGFIYTLSELERPPKTLVFMNSGVRLAAEREDTIELLRKIEARGVELLVCGTCLDYLHLKEGLRAGRVSNLYEIAETFLASTDVVTVS